MSGYVNRLYHDKQDTEIIADALDIGKNVLLLGPTGTGKTSLAEEVAKHRGQQLVYVPCHTGGTAEQLLGQMVPNPSFGLPGEPQFKWKDGLVTRAVKSGALLLLDEINSLRPEVTFCIHGLLDHRRELVLPDFPGDDDTIKAHPNFGIIAAGNPEYEGVQVMNEAFRDRFAIQLYVGYVPELDKIVVQRKEEALGSKGIGEDNVNAVCEFISKVRLATKRGTLSTDISTRAFIDLCDNLRSQTYMVARTVFETKFDDKDEMAAVSTIFDETWDATGKPRVQVGKSQARNRGGAGRFGN